MGNTCKPMAVSFQCMTKSTTNKKKKKKKSVCVCVCVCVCVFYCFATNKPFNVISPTPFAYFVSLCHIFVNSCNISNSPLAK